MVQAEELVHGLDREGLLLEGLVGLDEFQQVLLAGGGQFGLDGLEAEPLDLGALLGAHPGGIRGELAEDRVPFGFRQGRLLRREHEGAHRLDGRLPGRVDGIQRQHAFRGRLRQRLLADLGGEGEVALDGADLLDGDAHRVRRGRIEADELAAHEIVGDLVLQRLAGREGVGGLVSEGEDLLRPGFLPGCVVGEGGIECLDMVGCYSVRAAPVGRLADLVGNDRDEGCEGLVVAGGGGRDDAVAVELRLGEDLHEVGRILQRDAFFLELEVLEDLPCGGEETGPVGVLLVEAGEGNLRPAGEEGVGILQDAGQPLGRGDDLVHADVAVMVGVNQFQGFGIEFQVFGRAAEDGPHLAVQLAEVGDVRTGVDLHADGAADGTEFPVISHMKSCFRVFVSAKLTKYFEVFQIFSIFAVQNFEMTAKPLIKSRSRERTLTAGNF